MFEDLSARLDGILRKLRSPGVVREADVREALAEVRRALLSADVHFRVAKEFVQRVEARAVGQEVLQGLRPGQQVVKIVHEELVQLLGGVAAAPILSGSPPVPIMLVGLQGSGKTTTAAKLAGWARKQGRRPFLIPVDPYRPAARDQLIKLAHANGHPVYEGSETDPVQMARRGMDAAVHAAADVAILDTAGRLHIDAELMAELSAVRAAVKPREVLLVVDAMIGQDAVSVAEHFSKSLGFDGVILTKMDGDARGGAALSIRQVTGAPIKFLGVGESASALEPFYPDRMASRILNMGDVMTLVERAQEAIEVEEADDLARKLRKDQFDLEDFRDQVRKMKKMGPLSQMLGMLPGMPKEALQEVEKDGGRSMKRVEAILDSMTAAERAKPGLLNGSRRRRIARGSGTSVQEVNRLMAQFDDMRKMMKRMSKLGRGKGALRGGGRARFAGF
ncbi:MAG: signal recognition particle protein [bacterium]